MKIAVFSDVHANISALEAILNDIQSSHIDLYAFLGDLVINGPSPKQVFETIRKLNPGVWIKGNTDAWFDEIDNNWKPSNSKEQEYYEYYHYAFSRLKEEDIRCLKNLRLTQSLLIQNRNLLFVHGSPRSFQEAMDSRISASELEDMLTDVDEDIILCGHGHVPYQTTRKGKILVNVGSVGTPLDKDVRASYGIIEISIDGVALSLKRVSYDIEKNIHEARLNKFPYLEKYEQMIRRAEIIV